jgi:hypothetical protein
MSARKPRLVLTPRAPLRDLLRYTSRSWGRDRRDAYQAVMLSRLRELVDYSELGRGRDFAGAVPDPFLSEPPS